MAIYVYPENYTEPPAPPEVVLTTEQRATVKGLMETYITNQDRPILVRDLVDTGQNYIRENYGVHIPDQTLVDIALEIREAWGYPGQGEE